MDTNLEKLIDLTKESINKTADLIEGRKIETNHERLSQFFWGKTVTTFYAISALCDIGYGQDAIVLVRTMLENLINYRYINQEPEERGQLFIEFDYIKAKKRLRTYSVLFPEKEIDPEKIKVIEENYFSVIDNYPKSKSCFLQWSGKNNADMAKACDLENLYLMIYPLASSFAHGGSDSTIDYIQKGHRGFKIRLGSPSDILILQSVASACSIILLMIQDTCELFNIQPPAVCYEALKLFNEIQAS